MIFPRPPFQQAGGAIIRHYPRAISRSPAGEEEQTCLSGRKTLEYVAFVLLGLVLIAAVLYVTMSAEAEDPRKPNRMDRDD